MPPAGENNNYDHGLNLRRHEMHQRFAVRVRPCSDAKHIVWLVDCIGEVISINVLTDTLNFKVLI